MQILDGWSLKITDIFTCHSVVHVIGQNIDWFVAHIRRPILSAEK